MRSVAACAIAFWISAFAFADNDGALPRGPQLPLSKRATASAKPSSGPDCSSYLVSPTAGDVLFDVGGQMMYFLTKGGEDPEADAKTFLYEVDLGSYRYRRIVSLRASESTGIVGHGDPIQAISLFDFKQGQPGCGEGSSAGIGIQWGSAPKIVKSFPAGSIKIVPSDQGRLIADMGHRQIKMLDPHSFQKRTMADIPSTSVPLYLGMSPPELYAYSPEKNELLRYEKNSAKESASVILKKDMRLVQQNEQFGVLRFNDEGRKLQLNFLKGWSGKAFRSFDLGYPEPWTGEKMAAAIDFASATFVVYGATLKLRKELRQALVYNLNRSEIDKVVTAQPEHYLSQVAIDPKGKRLLILTRRLDNDVAQSLRIKDLYSGEWREVVFAQNSGKDGAEHSSPDPGK